MQKLNVNFYLKNRKAKNGLSPIYGKIFVGSSTATFSTGRSITKERWKATDCLRKPLRNSNEQSLQSYIKSISNQLDESYIRLLNSGKDQKQISAQALKMNFLGRSQPVKEIGIIKLMEEYVAHFTLKVHKNERSKGSLEKYQRMISVLKEYLSKNYRVNEYPFDKVNADFVFGLDSYLRYSRPHNGSLGIGHNTTIKYIRNMSVMVNFAMKRGKIQRNPFVHYDESLKEVDTVFLTESELSSIEEKDFSNKRLSLVKDLFIFSSYTALAPVDVMNLKKYQIQHDSDGCKWIMTKRQKTAIDSNVPILKPAEKILDKYKNDPRCIDDRRLLPKISNAKMNAYLKEIADICGINKNLTWYVARHTFATTVALANGIPLEIVSKIMGHKRITQTQHYAKILAKSVKSSMMKLNEKFK